MTTADRVQEIVAEAMDLAPELLDGDLSQKDRLRLMRLVFEIGELALDMYDDYSSSGAASGSTAASGSSSASSSE